MKTSLVSMGAGVRQWAMDGGSFFELNFFEEQMLAAFEVHFGFVFELNFYEERRRAWEHGSRGAGE